MSWSEADMEQLRKEDRERLPRRREVVLRKIEELSALTNRTRKQEVTLINYQTELAQIDKDLAS